MLVEQHWELPLAQHCITLNVWQVSPWFLTAQGQRWETCAPDAAARCLQCALVQHAASCAALHTHADALPALQYTAHLRSPLSRSKLRPLWSDEAAVQHTGMPQHLPAVLRSSCGCPLRHSDANCAVHPLQQPHLSCEATCLVCMALRCFTLEPAGTIRHAAGRHFTAGRCLHRLVLAASLLTQ